MPANTSSEQTKVPRKTAASKSTSKPAAEMTANDLINAKPAEGKAPPKETPAEKFVKVPAKKVSAAKTEAAKTSDATPVDEASVAEASVAEAVIPPTAPEKPAKTAAPKTAKKTAPVAPAASNGNSNIQSVNADSTGMKPQQRTDLDIEHYRQLLLDEMTRLEEERDYVRKSNSDMDGNMPEDPDSDEDTTDLASSLMDKEMDLSVEEEIEETMASIEHALRKMEDGTYGICDVSNQPIPKSRLELIPWASLTAQMQSMAEGE